MIMKAKECIEKPRTGKWIKRMALAAAAFIMFSYLYSRGISPVWAAVAIVLGRNLPKRKSMTTSNWALPKLSALQLDYAANDAYAALSVFRAMGSPYVSAEGVRRR